MFDQLYDAVSASLQSSHSQTQGLDLNLGWYSLPISHDLPEWLSKLDVKHDRKYASRCYLSHKANVIYGFGLWLKKYEQMAQWDWQKSWKIVVGTNR